MGIQILAGITIAGVFGACGSKLNAEIAEIAAKIKASPFWGKPIGGSGGTCFIAGTLISTQEGLVPIENIKTGDTVYSFNEEIQEVSEQVVEETFVRESNELVYIEVGDEIITTTPEHPFYVPQKGFVNAIDLRAGDYLWTVNGEYVIIEKIQHELLESPVKVYNFRVGKDHT